MTALNHSGVIASALHGTSSIVRAGGRVSVSQITWALIRARVRMANSSDTHFVFVPRSLEVHRLVRQGLYDGGLRYALVSFVEE